MSDFLQKRCKLGNNITSKLYRANAQPLNYDELDKNASDSPIYVIYIYTKKIKLKKGFLTSDFCLHLPWAEIVESISRALTLLVMVTVGKVRVDTIQALLITPVCSLGHCWQMSPVMDPRPKTAKSESSLG